MHEQHESNAGFHDPPLPYDTKNGLLGFDFHKPKHILSWKTLLNCKKDAEAIKDCIRNNEHIAITLYRDTQPHAVRMPGRTFPDIGAEVAESSRRPV